jgi:hypothetical protein
MSNPDITSMPNPTTHKGYVFVIDGEVGNKIYYDRSIEIAIAAMDSDPKVIPLTDEEFHNVGIGWTFDGTNFIPPTQ